MTFQIIMYSLLGLIGILTILCLYGIYMLRRIMKDIEKGETEYLHSKLKFINEMMKPQMEMVEEPDYSKFPGWKIIRKTNKGD